MTLLILLIEKENGLIDVIDSRKQVKVHMFLVTEKVMFRHKRVVRVFFARSQSIRHFCRHRYRPVATCQRCHSYEGRFFLEKFYLDRYC